MDKKSEEAQESIASTNGQISLANQDNEKILVVTHAGIIRSIKRIFIENSKKLMPDNLGTVMIDNLNYK